MRKRENQAETIKEMKREIELLRGYIEALNEKFNALTISFKEQAVSNDIAKKKKWLRGYPDETVDKGV